MQALIKNSIFEFWSQKSNLLNHLILWVQILSLILIIMQHYILTQNQKHRQKIEKHLNKYIDANCPAWILTTGQFEKLQFPKFRDKVKSYQITSLFLTNTYYPNILKDIGGGNFQYLITLSLSNNCILSVELLTQFNAPFLQGMILDRNLLINLRSLRKFVKKGLKILELGMNHIKDLTQLVQFDCPTLKYLSLSNNQNIGNLIPYMKAFMSPQILNLSKTNLVGPVAKKEFIDSRRRWPLDSGLPKTKI